MSDRRRHNCQHNSKNRLFAFIGDLRVALFLLIGVADVRPDRDQLVPEKLPLPLVELKDRSMYSAVGGHIFESKGVVLLVGESA